MALVSLRDVAVGFGDQLVLDGVDLELESGERCCLLGRNGAGKSTLLRVIEGTLEPDHGDVVRTQGLRVARLGQSVPAEEAGTVLDIVSTGSVAGTPRHVVERAISQVGLDPAAEPATLSAGLRRRVHLARALAAEPDVLLLDEPTNHLDVDGILWLEEFLLRQTPTVLFVTHDRAFLARLATRILDLDRGRLTSWPADYERYREKKAEALAVETRSRELFDKRLAQEESWIRQGVRERRKRNQGRVKHLEAMRRDRAARRDVPGRAQMEAHQGERSGRLVVQARDVGFAWDGAPIVRGLTTTILRGDRVGIIGPNGSGKTTLLRLLVGDLQPTEGSLKRGANLQVAYFDQLHAQLDDAATAAQNVCDHGDFVTVNGRKRHVIGYLGDFLFTPDQARSPVTRFSGGERNRLVLARILARPSNVLVLDEPTNDLDLETLELLEDLLDGYGGTILLVSHDRAFLDDVVTSTLVLEEGGRVGEYLGGYEDWRRQRKPPAPAEKPRARREKKPRAAPALTKEERRELKGLPAQIEALEEERDALHAQMAEPTFYRQDGDAMQEARERLRVVEADLESAYGRWESLEEKRERPTSP